MLIDANPIFPKGDVSQMIKLCFFVLKLGEIHVFDSVWIYFMVNINDHNKASAQVKTYDLMFHDKLLRQVGRDAIKTLEPINQKSIQFVYGYL